MELTRAACTVVVAGLLLGSIPSSARGQSTAGVDAYYEFLVARHLEGEGDNAGALAALQRAATAEPRSAEVRAEIAAFQMRHNQRGEAEKAAREALAIDENNMEANRVLGQILASNADRESTNAELIATYVRDAIKYLERATAASTGVADPNVNYTLAGLYLRSGQPEKATQAMARVLSQNPGSRQARMRMAQAQAQSKDLRGAITTLEEIVDDEPSVAASLAQYQVEAGLLREAADSYTRALAVAPTNRQIKARRILVFYDLMDFTQAAALAAEAQKQHPDDPQFPRLQASALYAGGNTPKAIEVLEATSATFPRDIPSKLVLADMYQKVKRFPDAEKVLRQMIVADPGNGDALNSLGYMLANNNDRLDEAIRLVNQALQKEPGNGAYLDSLGWAHFKKGNLDEAEKYLTEAIAKLPMNAEVLDHIGDLHARRSRWQQAIDSWSQALDGEGSAANKEEIQRKIENAKGKLQNAK
jgi:tetratricopeptide (TPR) repeat protein